MQQACALFNNNSGTRMSLAPHRYMQRLELAIEVELPLTRFDVSGILTENVMF